MKKFTHKLLFTIICFIAILSLVFIGCAAEKSNVQSSIPLSNSEIKVSYIDVGQGDSILIQQGNASMLIDAGKNDSADELVNYIKSQGVNKIDYVIATHPHEDHSVTRS